MKFKQCSTKKKLYAALLSTAVITASLPFSATHVQAENTEPEQIQFVTKDQLSQFNTNDHDGTKLAAKIHLGNNNQQWWIAGSGTNDTIDLFAASPMQYEALFNTSPGETTSSGLSLHLNITGSSSLYLPLRKKKGSQIKQPFLFGRPCIIVNAGNI